MLGLCDHLGEETSEAESQRQKKGEDFPRLGTNPIAGGRWQGRGDEE